MDGPYMKLWEKKKRRFRYLNGFCIRIQPLPQGLSLDQLPTCVRCAQNTYPLNSQGKAAQLSVYMTSYSKMVRRSCINLEFSGFPERVLCITWKQNIIENSGFLERVLCQTISISSQLPQVSLYINFRWPTHHPASWFMIISLLFLVAFH